MRQTILVGCLLGAHALAGCAQDGDVGSADQDATESRTYAFTDVNPEHPVSEDDRALLQEAFAKLDRVAKRGKSSLRRRLAEQTLERIEQGDVWLGSIDGARGIDRWHMCKDYELTACQGEAPADDDLQWLGDDEVARTLNVELDGYQWGNRLYFALGDEMEADDVATTLVHEVNHVLNRSECSYYRDIDAHVVDGTLAFVEEYRAFLSECYFVRDTAASLERCDADALVLVTDYGFAYDLSALTPDGDAETLDIATAVLDAEDGYEPSFGYLVPEQQVWPESFGACAQER